MSEAVLELDAVVVRYGRLAAVDGVTLAVAAGETIGLVGESGCGKTSLAKALVGLLPLAAGAIRIEGTEIGRRGGARRNWLPARIQLLFQDPIASLSPRLTVRRLLAGPLRRRGALDGAGWREV